MKSVLMSFSPYWYYLIGERIKKEEIRKRFAKLSREGIRVECYMTKDKKSFNRIPKELQEKYRSHMGKVGMCFVCDKTDEYQTEFYADDDTYQEIRRVWLDEDYDYPEESFEIVTTNEEDDPNDCEVLKNSCLTFDEMKQYIGYGDGKFTALHISDLKIYDTPKELGEFCVRCSDRKMKCNKCNYLKQDDYYEPPYCENGGYKEITRPPQSWQFCEV